MSAEATKWAWHQQLSSTAKLVLLYLSALLPAAERQVGPATSQIVHWTGLDKKTVYKCLEDLEAGGLISVTRSPGYASTYTLNIPEGGS